VLGAHSGEGAPSAPAWWMFGLLLVSGLVATIALSRAGVRHLWRPGAGLQSPRLKRVEGASILLLIAACVLLTVFAEPVLRYTQATAAALHSPAAYIAAVSSQKARPGPTHSAVEQEGAK